MFRDIYKLIKSKKGCCKDYGKQWCESHWRNRKPSAKCGHDDYDNDSEEQEQSSEFRVKNIWRTEALFKDLSQINEFYSQSDDYS